MRAGQLIDPVLEHVQTLLLVRVQPLQPQQLPARRLRKLVLRYVFRHCGVRAKIPVQVPDVGGGIQNALVQVLAVDDDQIGRQLLQRRERDGTTAYFCSALPFRREFALDKQGPIVLRTDVQLVKLMVHRRAAEREPARHIRIGAAGADQVLRRALAEQQAERIDDNRLAGARLAREDIEPAEKFYFGPFNDRYVFNIEPFKHLPATPFPTDRRLRLEHFIQVGNEFLDLRLLAYEQEYGVLARDRADHGLHIHCVNRGADRLRHARDTFDDYGVARIVDHAHALFHQAVIALRLHRPFVRRAADCVPRLPCPVNALVQAQFFDVPRNRRLRHVKPILVETREQLFLRLDRLGLDEFQNLQVPVLFQMNPSPSVASFWLSIL